LILSKSETLCRIRNGWRPKKRWFQIIFSRYGSKCNTGNFLLLCFNVARGYLHFPMKKLRVQIYPFHFALVCSCTRNLAKRRRVDKWLQREVSRREFPEPVDLASTFPRSITTVMAPFLSQIRTQLPGNVGRHSTESKGENVLGIEFLSKKVHPLVEITTRFLRL
jgi:hypothetical protein